MILSDGGKIISDTEKVSDTLNKFFVNIGNTLKIYKGKRFLVETNDAFDPVLKTTKKDNAHPNILNIKEKMNNSVFSFLFLQSQDIAFKIIKDIFANFILQIFKQCIIDGKFPEQFKKSRR